MLLAARTVIFEPTATPSSEKLGVITFALYLPFTKITQARALLSSAQVISAPSCAIFGAFTCAVNLVGSQLSFLTNTCNYTCRWYIISIHLISSQLTNL